MKPFGKIWKKYSFVLLIAFTIVSLFDYRFSLIAILCMTAPIAVSLFRGRYWCGNLCPRGSFYDSVISKISSHRNAPKILKSYYFRAAVFVIMMTMFTLGIRKNWGNPAGIGFVFYRMIIVTTLIGIALSLVYNQRIWCHFCPMGTAASVIGKLRNSKKILHISSSCISCKLCEKACPFSIAPYKYKGSHMGRASCIQCGKCVTVCPKGVIGYKPKQQKEA